MPNKPHNYDPTELPGGEIAVSNIGVVAHKLLDGASEAAVAGITSRGVFLRLPYDWMVFLSNEAYRGPLTLNVRTSPEIWTQIESASAFKIFSAHLMGASNVVILSSRRAKIWEAPVPEAKMLPAPSYRQRLVQIALELLGRKDASLVGDMLPMFLDLGLEAGASSGKRSAPTARSYLPRLERLQQALETRRPEAIAAALGGFLGLGSGLTPSGDDLVLGFLLALNRWGNVLAPDLDVPAINKLVIERACRETTTLSANLIECAAQGQADERLTLALDGILTGAVDAGKSSSLLADWGSSSGIDAFTGMALVIFHLGVSMAYVS